MLISTDFIKQFNDKKKKGFKFKIYMADILGETSRHKCKDFYKYTRIQLESIYLY